MFEPLNKRINLESLYEAILNPNVLRLRETGLIKSTCTVTLRDSTGFYVVNLYSITGG